MSDPSHDPTLQHSTLLRFAKAALADDADPQDLPWEEIDLSDPDQRQFGDYELLELLGRGGMGVVYRARHERLDREVAIKFIASNIADQPQAIGRFMAEAQAAAKLHHPNIVPVFEVGSVDCLYYFTMPLLRGKTLADVGRLPVDEAVALMRKLCSAVSYAHSLGLLHLDLKPANVMIDEHGRPMIGDFGLARQMDEARGVTAQEVSGTPAFMAPEQVQIKQYRLTEATDLYALGAMLYQLLSGQSPHGRGSAETLMKNATAGRIRRLRELDASIPMDLAAICEKCLELHQEDRYEDVAALGHDLDRFMDGTPVSVRSPKLPERVRRTVSRNPALSASVAAAVLALVIGFVGTAWQWREAERARLQAESNFENALAAANTLVWEVSHTVRPLIGSKADTVREILESAERIFDELGDRPEVAIARAEMLTQLSKTYADLGDIRKAEELADKSVARAEAAFDALPNDQSAMRKLAKALLARAQVARFKVASDRNDVERALQFAEQLLESSPDDLETILLTSEALDQMGLIILDEQSSALAEPAGQAEYPEALGRFKKSGEILRNALDQNPGEPRLLERLADHLDSHALHYVRLGWIREYPRVIEMEQESLRLRQQLAQLDQSNAEHVHEMARLNFYIGIFHDIDEKPDEKIEHYQRAIELFGGLIDQDPTNKDRLFQQVRVKGALARAYLDLGRTEDALLTYSEALSILDSLLQHDPANEIWLNRKAVFVGALADLHEARRDFEPAIRHHAQAVEIKRRINSTIGLSRELRGLAKILNWSMRAEEATPLIEESVSILRSELDTDPDRPALLDEMGQSQYIAATIAASRGRFEEAINHQERAVETWQYLLDNHPDLNEKYGDWRLNVAMDLRYLGLIHYLAGELDAAAETGRSASTRGALSEEDFSRLVPDPGTAILDLHNVLAEALVALDRPAEALAAGRAEICDPCRLVVEVRALDALGEPAAALDLIEQLVDEYADRWAYAIAYLYALRGDVEEAYSWLLKAPPQDRYLVNVDPRLESLRADPRWPELLDELKE